MIHFKPLAEWRRTRRAAAGSSPGNGFSADGPDGKKGTGGLGDGCGFESGSSHRGPDPATLSGSSSEERGAGNRRSGERLALDVDPLDGTNNYAMGLPVYGVSITLLHRRRPVLGVIYDSPLDRLYIAEKEKEPNAGRLSPR